MIKFKDPDNLPGSFTTERYLDGYIVSMIPGPKENNNWVLKLHYPIQCFDTDGKNYTANTFLLKPIGLYDKRIMKNSPWEPWRVTENEKIIEELSAFASVLDVNDFLIKIETYEDYDKFPFINAVIILSDKSKNINLRIV